MSHKTVTRFAKDDDGVIIKVHELWSMKPDSDINPHVSKQALVEGSNAEAGHSWVLDNEQNLPDGFSFDDTLTQADFDAGESAAAAQAVQDESDAENVGLAVESTRRDLVNKIATATGLDASETSDLFDLLGVSES